MTTPDKAYAAEQRLNTLWSLQPQAAVLAASGGQLINSAVAANLLALANPLNPGTYLLTGQVIISQTAGAGAPVLSLAGSLTTTACRIWCQEQAGYTSVAGGVTSTPTLGVGGTMNMTSSFTGNTMGANPGEYITLAGSVTVTVAGTFALQAACTIGADTWTALYGTGMVLIPQF